MSPYSSRKSTLFRHFTFALLLLLVGTATGQTPGKDGSLTVSSANLVVNLYKTVTANITAPASTVSVNNTTGISVGDYVMVYQAVGASISTTDDATYGTITNYNSAGLYELRGVQSVSTNSVTLTGPLLSSYSVAGKTQLIRIPQYTSLTINSGGSITAQAWNGSTGGVAALHVQGTATIVGSIDVSAKGFRGGALTSNGSQTLQGDTFFRTTSIDAGALKGEGIGDPSTISSTGSYGRGAPANGGGGGNRHNG
ncbi:MAG: hypothetical protein IH600_16090, partial [Bacteroidetes bacterium]|nr:hypothetical protein [Bacteroidota bacterium]